MVYIKTCLTMIIIDLQHLYSIIIVKFCLNWKLYSYWDFIFCILFENLPFTSINFLFSIRPLCRLTLGAATIAHWIRLRLPYCGPRFNSKHNIYASILNCSVKRTKRKKLTWSKNLVQMESLSQLSSARWQVDRNCTCSPSSDPLGPVEPPD